MAARTACSASWLHGALRLPTYGSAIQKLSGDTDVIPGRLLPIRVSEQRRGMIGHDQRNAVEGVDLVAKFAETLANAQHRLARSSAKREEHLRSDQVDLAMKVGDARG